MLNPKNKLSIYQQFFPKEMALKTQLIHLFKKLIHNE